MHMPDWIAADIYSFLRNASSKGALELSKAGACKDLPDRGTCCFRYFSAIAPSNGCVEL